MLETTVIGSYPQPDWLIDKDLLRNERVARVSRSDLWKVESADLNAAIQDATKLAILDMEVADIDVITDGEISRESYSNHFLCALEGIEAYDGTKIKDRMGKAVEVPRVINQIRRTHSVEIEAARFLRASTERKIKVTLPGPFTLSQQCSDEFYGDPEAVANAFAEAVNAEARELCANGVDVIQIDEPWFRNNPEDARKYGVKVVDRALEGVTCTKALHMCFGYGFRVPGDKARAYEFLGELAEASVDQISIEAAQPNLDLAALAELSNKRIMVGVLDLSSNTIESAETVAQRIRNALQFVDVERLIPAPDCGMKYLSRDAAFGKLQSLAQAAAIVRQELGVI